MRFQGIDYGVDVTRAAEQTRCPPLLALPPIGVGVTRAFYQPLAREWKALGGERVRYFSERNLFGRAENVDDEWMRMCRDGAADTRSRHATFAYLCGTVPGGSWRYDRKALLNAIDVPCQVIRGGSAEGAAERLAAFVDEVQRPSCCALVDDGRAVIPYEQSFEYATLLGRFLAINYEPDLHDTVTARNARRRSAPDRETA